MNVLLTVAEAIGWILAAAVLYQALGVAMDTKRYPPPGRLVNVAGRRIHVRVTRPENCTGPTVILESGIAASSPSWRLVEPEIARFARVVTYDRAGLGWSDLGRIPVTPEQILSDLRAALEGAGERPPYIFVGHSFGGLIAQIFAARHRGELAGMVLLDPPHWSEWHPDGPWQNQVILRHGARLSRRGAWCARLGVNRLLLTLLTAGFRRGPRAFVVAVSGRAITVANRIVGEVRKLPPETHAILKAIWSQPKCFESMATHLEALPAMCAEVARNSAPGALGNLPLVVITAGTPSPDRRRHQEEVAALSTHGQHIVAPQSGHWVQLDQPQLIVETVRHLMG